MTADLSDAAIAQIAIGVSSLDRALDFYRDRLGLRLLFTAPPQMAFFQGGAVRILVGESTTHAPGGTAVYFRVPDIQAVHETLRARGVIFAQTPHIVYRAADYDLWLAEFLDPDGNHLALMSEVPRPA